MVEYGHTAKQIESLKLGGTITPEIFTYTEIDENFQALYSVQCTSVTMTVSYCALGNHPGGYPADSNCGASESYTVSYGTFCDGVGTDSFPGSTYPSSSGTTSSGGGGGPNQTTTPTTGCRGKNCLDYEASMIIGYLNLSNELIDVVNNLNQSTQVEVLNFIQLNLDENGSVLPNVEDFVVEALEYLNDNSTISFQDLVNALTVVSPDNPITDIEEYLECFDTTQGATLTIYVNQPIANQDDAFSMDGGKAGHAFISLEQGSITRAFGLYPEGNATPFSPNDPFSFGNDQGEEFDVSISMPINFASLENIINDATNYNSNYDLNSNNCTDFVLDSAGLSGLNLPDPQGNWPNGSGSNPGAFGESLRDLNLPVGAARNNNGGNAPMNTGTCN